MSTRDRFCNRVYPEVDTQEDLNLKYSPNPLNNDPSTTLVVEDENDGFEVDYETDYPDD